jgi:hypothetical protein
MISMLPCRVILAVLSSNPAPAQKDSRLSDLFLNTLLAFTPLFFTLSLFSRKTRFFISFVSHHFRTLQKRVNLYLFQNQSVPHSFAKHWGVPPISKNEDQNEPIIA